MLKKIKKHLASARIFIEICISPVSNGLTTSYFTEVDRKIYYHKFTQYHTRKNRLDTNLASAKYLGAFDMLSMPPATTISLRPSCMLCAAKIVAVNDSNANVAYNACPYE